MNYIIYQAYGMSDIINECLYSLYTLSKFQDEFEVFIYTDKVEYFEKFTPKSLEIHYRKLEQSEIKKWRGKYNFVHRLKIMVLLDFLKKHVQNSDNILYVDSDVTFKKPVADLFDLIQSDNLLMHIKEGNILNPKKNKIFKQIHHYMKSKSKISQLIPKNIEMWNAGVLGFTGKDKVLIEQVLRITDQIYSEFQSHVVEQLVFSIVFSGQNNRKLFPTNDSIFHYWNFKEYRAVLNELFTENRTEESIKKNFKNIDPERLREPKMEYESFGFLKKTYRKIVGRWELPHYEIQ